MKKLRCGLAFCLVLTCWVNLNGQEPAPGSPDKVYVVRDTLSIGVDASEDAKDCLESLAWEPTDFEVRCSVQVGEAYDALVQFASPIDTGNGVNDQVALEWCAPRNEAMEVLPGPAVVVMHESDYRMHVGRMIAKNLRARGIHAFLMHLPGYGLRRGEGYIHDGDNFLTRMRQGVADSRRTFDVVAALPNVNAERIAIQGTSLGGFVASLGASLDGCFDRVLLVLSGAELYKMLLNGEKDTAAIRRDLAAVGLVGEKLKAEVYKVEPSRIAHRLDGQKTWLYSATSDLVVPLPNAVALAHCIGLEAEHHVQLQGNHYTAALHLPFILSDMALRIKHEESEAEDGVMR